MNNHRNLARTWRPKTFNEIVGQELTVRMVKNSLFRQLLFPVYLLAGQRGCGKTTVGRLLAAAVNCAQYETFCAQPKDTVLPCGTCESCCAMSNGSHPDFYEIDAASHTGVDNVRALIDAASLLPVLGRKKIYLIDEAHMLSKAAFNALLKVLEEPPASVLFVLATTDPHKVLETVRSRCFQLFFNPVSLMVLQQHLIRVCTQEGIPYDDAGLLLIAQESEGSVRDALNGVERVRMAYGGVRYEQVCAALGDLSYERIIALCNVALTARFSELMVMLNTLNLKNFSASQFWKRMTEVLRCLIWAHHHIPTPGITDMYEYEIEQIIKSVSVKQLLAAVQLWYEAEPLFAKTHNPYVLIEAILLRMGSDADTQGPEHAQLTERPAVSAPVAPARNQAKPEPVLHAPEKREGQRAQSAPWTAFIAYLEKHEDPLLLSIFKQGEAEEQANGTIVVKFAQHVSFFNDLLIKTTPVWESFFKKAFGESVNLQIQFDATLAPAHSQRETQQRDVEMTKGTVATPRVAQRSDSALDIRDKQQWQKVHELLQLFPGTVTEEKETL